MAQNAQTGVQGHAKTDSQGHAQSHERDTPFLACLHELVNASTMAAPFQYLMSEPAAIFKHVGANVVTTEGHVIVQVGSEKRSC